MARSKDSYSDRVARDPQTGTSGLPRHLKRLLTLAKPYWRSLSLATAVLIMSSTLNLAIPQVVRVVIDNALAGGNLTDINFAALILFSISVSLAVATGIRYLLFTVTGERVVSDLRQRLYGRIVSQEMAFFDERRTGELMNRLASDTAVVQSAVSVNISMVFKNVGQAIGSLVLLFYTSVSLTFVMLIIVPPIAVLASLFGKRIRLVSRESQDALAKAGEVAEETLSGIRTVRVFGHERYEEKRYGDEVEHAFTLAKRRIFNITYFSTGAALLSSAAMTGVMWFGGRLVVEDEMSIGDLISYILYTGMIYSALSALADLWAQFMRAIGASERLFELIDREPTIANEVGDTLDRVRGHVELAEVSFRYPSRPDTEVLKQISFDIFPGEVVALVGPSGGGKSTIANLISRLYDPQFGAIRIDGHDVKDLNATWLRRNIGVVSQEPVLFSTTLAENIRYGKHDATHEEVIEAARAANADRFVIKFTEGYNTPVGERGVQLSGGQKQRVAIARALLKDPPVLILDEATSALDADSEFLVHEALETLMLGRSTLVIAHRLSTIKDANRVIVVENGGLVQTGKHDELMDQVDGTYRRLVEKQVVGT